jgi:uncharacterized delta-60 repeat protein
MSRPNNRRPVNRVQLHLDALESRDVPTVVGGLDPSFSTDGKLTLNFGDDDHVNAVAVQPDGKIVAVGSWDGGRADFAIARFNPDGTPDTTFGGAGGGFAAGSGKANVFFGASIGSGQETATSVAIQPDGKIVVAGYSNINTPGGQNDFAIARLLPDGTDLDHTFGPLSDGKITINWGADDKANAVALRPDGRIVVAGSWAGANADFAIAQLTPDGKLDTTFGGGFYGAHSGKFNLSFGTGSPPFEQQEFATGVAIQPGDGKIVVVGYSDINTNAGPNDFAIARLLADGTDLDHTFGPLSDGKITINFGNDDKANAVALRPDGRIVVAGSWTGGASDFAVAQLTPDGKLDTTFGGGQQGANSGKFNFSFGTGSPPFEHQEFATGVALQPDGKIVMVGYSDINVNLGPNDFAIGRVLPDGTGLDPTFGTGGKMTVDFGGEDRANAVAIDPNGRIVVGGFAGASPSGDFAIVRLIGRTEDGLRLAAGGSLDGRATVFNPDFATGQLGTPVTTPSSVFPGFTGNVRVAVGDVNGDGVPDVALVTGPGTPLRFAVLSGVDNATPLIPVTAPFAGSESFAGGGFVAVADLDNDGRAEVILTADQGGGPRVTIFGLSVTGSAVVKANFLGIDDPSFRGGARAAAGDVNGDGFQDLAVAAGFLGGPRVALFDGKTLFATPTRILNDFFAFPGDDATRLRNGAFVAIGDVDGNGFADLIFGGGPGGAPRVFILPGQIVATGNILAAQAAPVANFFVAGNVADRGGIRVAATDADGDQKSDLAVGSGEGSAAHVRVYLGKNFTTTSEPGTVQDLSVFGGATLTNGVFVG